MHTFIVAGGAGFIGSEFVRQLSPTGAEVIVLDKLTYAGDTTRLAGCRNVKFLKSDIKEIKNHSDFFMKNISDLQKCILVNFAAESHVDRSVYDGMKFYETNVLGTQALLEFSTKNGIEKFVQVSTDEVYGSLESGVASEGNALRPASAYSASKAAADLAVLAHSETHGLNVSITRASNTFGAYQFPEKLIPRAIVLALSGKAVEVYGDGRQVREWISAADHARGILEVCIKGKNQAIYNLGSGVRLSNIELVTQILQRLSNFGITSEISFVADRPGHDFRYALDSSKAKSELNWTSSGIDTNALANTIDWYLQNQEWWGRHLHGSERISYSKSE